MRITSNMLMFNSRRISSSLLGTTLAGQVGRKHSASALKSSGRAGSFYDSYANQVKNYTKIGSSAESLRSSASQFASKSGLNMFNAARRSGNTGTLLSQAKNMVKEYNNTINSLNGRPSSANLAYRNLLQDTFGENSEALSSIGITIGKDHKLSIDENQFNSAGIDKIEQVLGADNGFTSRVASISGGISSSTGMNAYSPYGQYGQYGLNSMQGYNNYLSAIMGSRYNFWM